MLITGADGQIGTALRKALAEKWGHENVIATDIREIPDESIRTEKLDVLDQENLNRICRENGVTQIYHLAAILSARAEKDPRRSWEINMAGWFNILDIAREMSSRVFFPSSVAVFGSHTPSDQTPQYAVQQPETVYGISKVAGESWAHYYYTHYGLDVRSLRFPGLISYEAPPGGGTTDYAVEIFHKAIQRSPFTCFLREDTRLPMLYMPDAIRAMIELMDAPAESISVRTSYNLGGMSFTPAEIAGVIQKHIPDLEITYKPDYRQQIADSWSHSIDDSLARKDWGWQPEFNLESMTEDMLKNLSQILETA